VVIGTRDHVIQLMANNMTPAAEKHQATRQRPGPL